MPCCTKKATAVSGMSPFPPAGVIHGEDLPAAAARLRRFYCLSYVPSIAEPSFSPSVDDTVSVSPETENVTV